ncbi:MAG: hypothetical protein J3R72DRAFT_526055 [Linnemannia gamsii]|nr:MAG: hypothetical protein J3R72DRAFT_526055 [Linnemannia gamsii]
MPRTQHPEAICIQSWDLHREYPPVPVTVSPSFPSALAPHEFEPHPRLSLRVRLVDATAALESFESVYVSSGPFSWKAAAQETSEQCMGLQKLTGYDLFNVSYGLAQNWNTFSILRYDSVATRLRHMVEKKWMCQRLKSEDHNRTMAKNVACPCDKYLRPAYDLLVRSNAGNAGNAGAILSPIGKLTEVEVLNLRRNDDWSVDEEEHRYPRNFKRSKQGDDKDGDASFPGLLSLDAGMMKRPRYLYHLPGLTRLKELRGHVQAMKCKRQMMLGLVREINHQRIETFACLVWLKKHRPGLCLKQGSVNLPASTDATPIDPSSFDHASADGTKTTSSFSIKAKSKWTIFRCYPQVIKNFDPHPPT